jgi:SAM-dependent methyltransferase
MGLYLRFGYPADKMNKPEGAKQHKTEKNQREWYKVWFDSPYYHILYKYRDEAEAEGFIDQLLKVLDPAPGARILDLACGRGRYSRHLAKKGFEEVIGLDLSKNSIEYARQFESDNLSFFTHDMRLPFRINYFDYVFNFFTSFGYFNSEKEDLKTLRNVALGLKQGGIFVLDFFNSQYVIDHLTGRETKVIDGIHFDIDKQIEGDRVIKTIDIEDEGGLHFFRERVRLYLLEDFHRLFEKTGMRILWTYGDYQLHPFDEADSPRLILVAQRKDCPPSLSSP